MAERPDFRQLSVEEIDAELSAALEVVAKGMARGGMLDVQEMRRTEQVLAAGHCELLIRAIDWETGNPAHAVQYAQRLDRFLVDMIIPSYAQHVGFDNGVDAGFSRARPLLRKAVEMGIEVGEQRPYVQTDEDLDAIVTKIVEGG